MKKSMLLTALFAMFAATAHAEGENTSPEQTVSPATAVEAPPPVAEKASDITANNTCKLVVKRQPGFRSAADSARVSLDGDTLWSLAIGDKQEAAVKPGEHTLNVRLVSAGIPMASNEEKINCTGGETISYHVLPPGFGIAFRLEKAENVGG